jgi:hypothetical protein
MEHLRKPVEAFRWLAERLAPNGVLYVTVPNMMPKPKETFRRFHFAHVHGFTEPTLEWAGQAAGLERDPRFQTTGTRMVFRKAAAPITPAIPEGAGRNLPALYPNDSIARYVLSGQFFLNRVRQLRTTIRDARKS